MRILNTSYRGGSLRIVFYVVLYINELSIFSYSRKFEIPCGNRTVNFASISSYDIVFLSNVIGTEANGAFVLAEQ